MRRFLTFCLVLLTASTIYAASPNREYIIVSGGPTLLDWEKFKTPPHDIWWANFIRSAGVRIQEIKAQNGDDARITWLVHRPSYERRKRQNEGPLTQWISELAQKHNARLIWFSNPDEVINYLNAGLPRDQVKIANLEFFVHSNKACFMFDYSNEIDSASKSWLHENELKKIRRGIFAPNAFVKSWGCHTGESMSRAWKRATGVPMIGAIGKTDYAPGPSPRLSTGGRWTK